MIHAREATSPSMSSSRSRISPAALFVNVIATTRDGVIEAVTTRLDLPQKSAAEAYTLAEQFEPNPRSVWGYVQGLTRLSQRTPWQDGRFVLDRAASRLLTTVH